MRTYVYIPLLRFVLCTAFLFLYPSTTLPTSADYTGNWTYHGSAEMILNPDRGFRFELDTFPQDVAKLGEACKTYNLTVSQVYCYLDSFIGKPLPSEILQAIAEGFAAMRSLGVKALLRFAYERDMPPAQKTGPTFEDIFRHVEQLTNVVVNNTDVIYALQAGFIGAWGEWHSSVHHLEDNHTALAYLVASELYKWWPRGDRQVLVRVPRYKEDWLLKQSLTGFSHWKRGVVGEMTQHSSAAFARIGFHDDGFMNPPSDGGTWPEAPFFANPGNAQFDYMTAESAYLPVDGEMYWRSGTTYPLVDGYAAALRLRRHHYTTLSIVHGFDPLGLKSNKVESTKFMDQSSANESINVWMATDLNTTAARADFLPMSPAYSSTTHTVFEYIRDHLGYRIELQSASYSITPFIEHNITFDATLINYGFSAPINLMRASLVFLNKDKTSDIVWGTPILSCDPRRWQPYQVGDPEYLALLHSVHHYAALPASLFGATWTLGLHISDDNSTSTPWTRKASFAMRFANEDVPWWVDSNGNGGVNLLGDVTVPR